MVIAYLLAMTFCEIFFPIKVLPELRRGYQDFTIFYTGALLIGSGHSSALYDLQTQFKTQQSFTNVPIRLGPLPFNHPPFEALFFVPFTWMNYWHAYLTWTTLNVCMLAACVFLMKYKLRQFSEIPLGAVALGSIAFFPLIMALVQGQDIVTLLLLFISAIILLERGMDAWAGALLGLTLFRPQFALPIVVLLSIRRWRVLLGFGPVAALLGLITVWLMGWSGPLDYARFVLRLEGNQSRAFGPKDVPNLRGLISDIPGLDPTGTPAHVLIVAASALVLFLALRRIAKGHDSLSYVAGLAVITTTLVNFHCLVYDLSLLLPTALAYLLTDLYRNAERLHGPRLALGTLLFLTPLYVALIMWLELFYLFTPVLIWLYVEMLRSPSPAEVPA